MKYIIPLLAILCFCGCGDDDPVAPVPTKSIVGSWAQVYEDPSYHYTITFRADFTGSEWAKHDGDPEFTSEFTWTTSNNTVSVLYDSGDNFSASYTLGENTLTLDMGGTSINFTKIE